MLRVLNGMTEFYLLTAENANGQLKGKLSSNRKLVFSRYSQMTNFSKFFNVTGTNKSSIAWEIRTIPLCLTPGYLHTDSVRKIAPSDFMPP